MTFVRSRGYELDHKSARSSGLTVPSVGCFWEQASGEPIGLFSSSPDGSIGVEVSGPMVSGGDVTTIGGGNVFAWYEDSSRILYTADQLEDNRYELFIGAPDGGLPNLALSGALVTDGDVLTFKVK